jgi:hypothetical protein
MAASFLGYRVRWDGSSADDQAERAEAEAFAEHTCHALVPDRRGPFLELEDELHVSAGTDAERAGAPDDAPAARRPVVLAVVVVSLKIEDVHHGDLLQSCGLRVCQQPTMLAVLKQKAQLFELGARVSVSCSDTS